MNQPSGPLEILWEDPHGLAVNKPAGLLTQPARAEATDETLAGWVRSYLGQSGAAPVYLGTVHRLDRPVSGLILWAKTPKAARRWSEQFARRQTRKTYWAIVEVPGSATLPASEEWTDWLTSPDLSGRAQVVVEGTPGAVRAVTRVRSSFESDWPVDDRRFAWLKLEPETGRTHQLRAQTAARGRPIVGDATYGAATVFPAGIALHARTLVIEHPIRRDPLVLEAPLPPAWSNWLEAQSLTATELSQKQFPKPEV